MQSARDLRLIGGRLKTIFFVFGREVDNGTRSEERSGYNVQSMEVVDAEIKRRAVTAATATASLF